MCYNIFGKRSDYGTKGKANKEAEIKARDLTFSEAETLLQYLSYSKSNKGKTSGSRVVFISKEHPPIFMHRPHSRKELLEYQVKQLIEILEQEGLL